MQFGFPEDAGAGVVFSVFDTATAQEVLDYEGQFDGIDLRAELGTDLEELRGRIEAALPDGTEVISAEEAAEEFGDFFEFFIGPLQTILLTFAFIVLFVSTFIISNTFNIVLGQRVRELSLLRALGATPRQVRRSVLIESLVIGAAASASGHRAGHARRPRARGAVRRLRRLPSRRAPAVEAAHHGLGVRGGRRLHRDRIAGPRGQGVTGVAGGRPSGEAPETTAAICASGGSSWAPLWRSSGSSYRPRAVADFDSTTAQLLSLGIGAAVVFVAVAVLSPLIAGPDSGGPGPSAAADLPHARPAGPRQRRPQPSPHRRPPRWR